LPSQGQGKREEEGTFGDKGAECPGLIEELEQRRKEKSPSIRQERG